jgi:hypothetical protein
MSTRAPVAIARIVISLPLLNRNRPAGSAADAMAYRVVMNPDGRPFGISCVHFQKSALRNR